MSQYATEAQLWQHGLPSTSLTGVSTDTINAALQAASETADSYIPSRYSPPLTDWGLDLTRAVCRIAAWALLTSTRGASPDDPGVAAMVKNHDDAIAWLRDVASGKAHLNLAATAPAVIAAPRVVTTTRRGKWI